MCAWQSQWHESYSRYTGTVYTSPDCTGVEGDRTGRRRQLRGHWASGGRKEWWTESRSSCPQGKRLYANLGKVFQRTGKGFKKVQLHTGKAHVVERNVAGEPEEREPGRLENLLGLLCLSFLCNCCHSCFSASVFRCLITRGLSFFFNLKEGFPNLFQDKTRVESGLDVKCLLEIIFYMFLHVNCTGWTSVSHWKIKTGLKF